MSEQVTIILKGDQQAEHACKLVRGVTRDKDNPWCMTLERYKKVKTRQQERLYWKRLEQFTPIVLVRDGHSFHMNKDGWHAWLALKFLEPIVIPGPEGQDILIPRSTKRLNTAQYSKYMEDIADYALHQYGIILYSPIDMME